MNEPFDPHWADELPKAEKKNTAAGSVTVLDEKQTLVAGAKLFNEKGCIACHGMKGEGNNIGPNLTDNYWINGCKEENVVKIITNGKPEKGMTPFKSSLSDDEIKQVSKYILNSLAGSNPPNAKAPQGEACK